MAARVFCLYCRLQEAQNRIHARILKPHVSRRALGARRGLREEQSFSSDAKKLEARRTGIRGEHMPTGICGGRGTYRGAELHSARIKAKSTSSVTMARR